MELCRDERSGSSHRLMAIKSEKFTYPNEASCESCSEEAATAIWRAVRSKAPRLVVAVAMVCVYAQSAQHGGIWKDAEYRTEKLV
jgi:hypothetical protein